MHLYELSASRTDGTLEPLSHYKGKVLLIVNTASRCGFTPQYAELQTLYERYRVMGFEILGFPCNQFGRQEPGENDEIQRFCTTTYRVSFPIFEKIDVNGPQTHPIYRYLKSQASGVFGLPQIKWNFTKFLVNRRGGVVDRFAPMVRPLTLAPAIERCLSDRSGEPD